jgi:hypothetical protein
MNTMELLKGCRRNACTPARRRDRGAERQGRRVSAGTGATRSHAQRSEHGEDGEDPPLAASLGAAPPAFARSAPEGDSAAYAAVRIIHRFTSLRIYPQQNLLSSIFFFVANLNI